MASEYVSIPVRSGFAGATDKHALIDAAAWTYSMSEQIQDLTLKLIAPVGNDAAKAASLICAFTKSRPYRREPGEIFRDPRKTAQLGGDCDDLALLAASMMRAVGIPVQFRYAFRPDNSAKHIWIAYQAPAMSGTWQEFDPVEDSERDWMLGNGSGESAPSPARTWSTWELAAALAVGWFVGRRS
jgi:hypothetical protein